MNENCRKCGKKIKTESHKISKLNFSQFSENKKNLREGQSKIGLSLKESVALFVVSAENLRILKYHTFLQEH